MCDTNIFFFKSDPIDIILDQFYVANYNLTMRFILHCYVFITVNLL